MGWTLSIDFGTTNTAAAYALDGQPPRPVRLSSAADTIPSAVLAGPTGLLVGVEAIRSRRLRPECFVESPKLAVGQDAMMLGDNEIPVTTLVARVLGHVVRTAARYAGSDVPQRVVLTHPQDWATPRREALLAAWAATGVAVDDVRLVSEPIAAASWLATETNLADGATIGVLDYGGGTCDVAVLRRAESNDQPWAVLAHGGRGDVGGAAIDLILLRWVRETLERLGNSEVAEALDADLAALRTVQDEVRLAKEALSEWSDAAIPIAVGPHSCSLSITAEEFDRLIEDEVSKAHHLTERVLRDAGVAANDLEALYLTGGSSHLRAVHASLAELLGGRPATLGDPKLVVALGAHEAATAGLVRALPPGISAGAARLLTAQPSLLAAVESLPNGPHLLDDRAVLTAVLGVPGLLEEIVERPARLAELGSGANGELFVVPEAEDTALLPVRIFFADSLAWSQALNVATWRKSFVEWETGGLFWAANVTVAWDKLAQDGRRTALADPTWTAGNSEEWPDWLNTDVDEGSVWIASREREAPAQPASVEANDPPVGFPRPFHSTPQQEAVLSWLEQLDAFEDDRRFRRKLSEARTYLASHGTVLVRVVNGKVGGTSADLFGEIFLSVGPIAQFALVLVASKRLLVLTPDVVTAVRSKFRVYWKDPVASFPRRAIVQTTQRPGATDPPSAAEVHLIMSSEPDLAGLLRRRLGR
ncbi:Hsp70 family protein [Tenggerimyces flavus]|uniref:Hsp70 family protein n=1 Tax=Tenggerimyces flavus TaxID=1708749 RepID=A0ABV7YBP4_9ACTN|nr:Hsp70 family protein [Tenggerimyces flavus]MBM7783745.1 actin-like ATPase involved in cell morphogenesis [Tenggerimyces flavus]